MGRHEQRQKAAGCLLVTEERVEQVEVVNHEDVAEPRVAKAGLAHLKIGLHQTLAPRISLTASVATTARRKACTRAHATCVCISAVQIGRLTDQQLAPERPEVGAAVRRQISSGVRTLLELASGAPVASLEPVRPTPCPQHRRVFLRSPEKWEGVCGDCGRQRRRL